MKILWLEPVALYVAGTFVAVVADELWWLSLFLTQGSFPPSAACLPPTRSIDKDDPIQLATMMMPSFQVS